MGTHPIFESDFDCLTDLIRLLSIMARNSVTAGGVSKYSRSAMYSKRAQHKRTKTVTKAEKKTEEGIFEKKDEKYTASEQRKADQKAVDAGLLKAIGADAFMKGYLQKEFGLSRHQYPHLMKF